ncbi:hypothetical protein PVAP13_1KG249505 [Panicum virgatum]|uniref:Secreted protein n=1 Tax=Panicum virgatum TaxID=38727 RepID=A0A8T0XG87_PANVG|nr:hypothetical protein PVAP13_1KG249505 [Panicum virgatum]
MFLFFLVLQAALLSFCPPFKLTCTFKRGNLFYSLWIPPLQNLRELNIGAFEAKIAPHDMSRLAPWKKIIH